MQVFHECPDAADCSLEKQVEFYMGTYAEVSLARLRTDKPTLPLTIGAYRWGRFHKKE